MFRSLLLAACLALVPEAVAQSGPLTLGPEADVEAILVQSRALSAAYVRGDIDALVAVYAEDGIAAPSGRDFVRGPEALHALWALPPGRVITHHAATPEELRVEGDLAYDWGYYEGAVEQDGEPRGTFDGKYLIVWQRDADGVWRIAHDMWNSLAPSPPEPSPLEGAWVAEAFGGEIHERWEAGRGGSLVKAEGAFVLDGDTTYSERVTIDRLGGATYLVAHPSTGGVLVWEQTSASEDGMTFENTNVANPARIEYRFTGDRTFTRTLTGRENGESVVNELRFVRR